MEETKTIEIELKWRPFCETIVDAIDGAHDDMVIISLEELLKKTEIKKNHDKIIATLQRKRKERRLGIDKLNVIASLLEQKKIAEAEEGREKRAAADNGEA